MLILLASAVLATAQPKNRVGIAYIMPAPGNEVAQDIETMVNQTVENTMGLLPRYYALSPRSDWAEMVNADPNCSDSCSDFQYATAAKIDVLVRGEISSVTKNKLMTEQFKSEQPTAQPAVSQPALRQRAESAHKELSAETKGAQSNAGSACHSVSLRWYQKSEKQVLSTAQTEVYCDYQLLSDAIRTKSVELIAKALNIEAQDLMFAGTNSIDTKVVSDRSLQVLARAKNEWQNSSEFELIF